MLEPEQKKFHYDKGVSFTIQELPFDEKEKLRWTLQKFSTAKDSEEEDRKLNNSFIEALHKSVIEITHGKETTKEITKDLVKCLLSKIPSKKHFNLMLSILYLGDLTELEEGN